MGGEVVPVCPPRGDRLTFSNMKTVEDVESSDGSVLGLRLFALNELEEIVLHPPMKRFIERWQPGDPAVYLGSLWIR